jgi:hypothetical protein
VEKVIIVLLFFSLSLAAGEKKKQSDITTLCGPMRDSTVYWLDPVLCKDVFGEEAVTKAKAIGRKTFVHNRGRETAFFYDKDKDVFFVKINFVSDTMEAPLIFSDKTENNAVDEVVWDPVQRKLIEVKKTSVK